METLILRALQWRHLVIALSVVMMITGVKSTRKAPLDVFPEFAPPLVEIQTEAPGLSTEEVESLVSIPLENALNGVPWVRTIRSKSVLGLSSVVLLFEEGTDLMRARQLVQERLMIEGARLPAAVRTPVMLSPLSSTSRMMKIGVKSTTLSQMQLSELAKWTVRPRLMAIQGVANVAIWGQRDHQYQIRVDPRRLAVHGVTLDEVMSAARDATGVGAGGFLDGPNQRLPVRHVSSVLGPEDLAKVAVSYRGAATLTMADVAEIVESHPAPIGDAIIDDVPGLLLIVEKQPWGNTLEVTRQVEEVLVELKPALEGVEVDPTIFRPATFIERSIANLSRAMLIGCVLVMVVLIVFLNDARSALISLTAIPLSVSGALLAIQWMGLTINTMVLAGLVIAVGEVVDDAIIDVENVRRRLKLNQEDGHPLSTWDVVLQASLEVRSAVVYASLIVVLVFMPIYFLDGLSGSFFRPLAIAYVLAIMASLLVALTVTPVLCLLLLPGGLAKQSHDETPPVVRELLARYRRVLPAFLDNPRASLAGLVVLLMAALAIVPFLGEEFLPSFQETDFLMHWVEKPGTSIEAMSRITVSASKELRAIPGVRNFGSHIGRAEVADEVVGPNFTELWISIDDTVDYTSTLSKVQEIVDGYPGLYRDVLTYLKERIKEVLAGASSSIVVRLYGPDMEVLRRKAHEVEAVLKDVPGIYKLKVEPQVLVPQVDVRFLPEELARHGLTPGSVRNITSVLLQGTRVGEVYREQKTHDVVVWGTPSIREDIEDLRRFPIATPAGGHVPLGELATIQIRGAPNTINHERASRRLDVLCDVKGADLGSVARAIEERVRKVPFDRGYHPELLGEYKARQESRSQLIQLSLISILGIVVLLLVDFQSWRLTGLVLGTLPFALIGGVGGAVVSGGVLSLGSLVGFITVLGIAARNGIMLVSHYRHLEEAEGLPFGRGLVQRGAEERLAPILMTALCAGLALVPLVVSGNKPGHEIEHPMAIVILGGLVTSTILNLFLLPSLYLRFRGARPLSGSDSKMVTH